MEVYLDNTVLEDERKRGYERALADNNIDINQNLIRHGNTDYKSGYNKVMEMLNENNK